MGKVRAMTEGGRPKCRAMIRNPRTYAKMHDPAKMQKVLRGIDFTEKFLERGLATKVKANPLAKAINHIVKRGK